MGGPLRLVGLVAPNAGYKLGLVGIADELTVKASQSLTLPMLLIAIDRPESGPDIKYRPPSKT